MTNKIKVWGVLKCDEIIATVGRQKK